MPRGLEALARLLAQEPMLVRVDVPAQHLPRKVVVPLFAPETGALVLCLPPFGQTLAVLELGEKLLGATHIRAAHARLGESSTDHLDEIEKFLEELGHSAVNLAHFPTAPSR